MKTGNDIIFLSFLIISTAVTGCKKTGNTEAVKIKRDIEKTETETKVKQIKIDELSVSFTPPRKWTETPQSDSIVSGEFAGARVKQLHTFNNDSYGAVYNFSKLISKATLDQEWYFSYQDAIKSFLEKNGSVDFTNYTVDVFNVNHWKMRNDEVQVHKIYYASPYTPYFVVDVVIPQNSSDTAAVLSIIESIASVKYIS